MLEITDLASSKLKEVIDTGGGRYLRVVIEGMGWGGPKLGLALDEPQENEEAINVNGIDVLIGAPVKPFADDKIIDYIEADYGKGFLM